MKNSTLFYLTIYYIIRGLIYFISPGLFGWLLIFDFFYFVFLIFLLIRNDIHKDYVYFISPIWLYMFILINSIRLIVTTKYIQKFNDYLNSKKQLIK